MTLYNLFYPKLSCWTGSVQFGLKKISVIKRQSPAVTGTITAKSQASGLIISRSRSGAVALPGMCVCTCFIGQCSELPEEMAVPCNRFKSFSPCTEHFYTKVC